MSLAISLYLPRNLMLSPCVRPLVRGQRYAHRDRAPRTTGRGESSGIRTKLLPCVPARACLMLLLTACLLLLPITRLSGIVPQLCRPELCVPCDTALPRYCSWHLVSHPPLFYSLLTSACSNPVSHRPDRAPEGAAEGNAWLLLRLRAVRWWQQRRWCRWW